MAEVEDDYDDESCSSSEGIPHQRLDRALETKPSDDTIAGVTTMIRPEETSTEESHAIESDLPNVASKTENESVPVPTSPTTVTTDPEFHEPRALPKFRDPKICMWTSSHAANAPSEDRSSSMVNILLRPLPEEGHEKADNRTLVRVSLWSVIDGHGGGCVATYASEVLLPHVAASMASALKCEIVDRGVCSVNGELRDANALDLDGLIRTSDRSRANANSIRYQSHCDVAGEEDGGAAEDPLAVSEEDTVAHDPDADHNAPAMQAEASITLPMLRESDPGTSVSSAKTSVKSAASHPHGDAPVGTHSPGEVASITQAITESFLAVDEGWINSIDPVATHQTSCQSNGRWNAGACALVVFTVQRLEWTSASAKNVKVGMGDQDPRDDTPHNKDAARLRMLDNAARAKSASSISSTSSVLTDADPNNLSEFESEITETEDDGGESDLAQTSRKSRARQATPTPSIPAQTVITTSGGCECHVYRSQEAMLYTAHVGDCRAVLLGSALPRTIKVGPVGDSSIDHPDTTDDDSSHHSSDETECLSSSDHDAESSEEEDAAFERNTGVAKTPPYLKYMRRPARRQSRRLRRDMGSHAPFVALPPLPVSPHSSSEDSESDTETLAPPVKPVRVSGFAHDSDDNSNESSLICGRDVSPPLKLAPTTRPIDLTTDHSAYNPAEVSAVLRRCNNAPRAISASLGGGIKRVAGSLAVTRALGDAYLKTPKLSFQPYAKWCPYITARPEVNFRLLSKDGDRVLILATDGVWERCSGEDVLRWVRNHSAERIAQAERRNNRRLGSQTDRMTKNDENPKPESHPPPGEDEKESIVGQKRGRLSPVTAAVKKRKVLPRRGVGAASGGLDAVSTVADVIVRRVLNKVRRARNMTSLHALLSLPKGRARRSKHDDITASVIDLSAFVS
jgi:serine/threonine protein phosphatase PrpC